MKIIRTAVMSDLDAVASVEAECFPPAEACQKGGICGASPGITVTISG